MFLLTARLKLELLVIVFARKKEMLTFQRDSLVLLRLTNARAFVENTYRNISLVLMEILLARKILLLSAILPVKDSFIRITLCNKEKPCIINLKCSLL